ncbi:MAG: hypothetical protein ACAH95_10480 [Fimbriimonas sp.]
MLIAGFVACCASLTQAADIEVRGASVYVNGRLVFDVKSEAGGLSADVRAELIAGALDAIEDPKVVEIRESAMDYAIFADGFLVATVTPAEAAKHRISVLALAKQWASRLGQALAMPPLKLGASDVSLPLGDAKIISLIGTLAKKATIESTNDNVVLAERSGEGIRLRGKGMGQATVIVKSGDHTQMMDVTVRPWAATLPKAVRAEVTGSPASGSTVQGAISYALRTLINPVPAADLSFQPPAAGALGPGKSRSYTVRYRASAPNAFDRTGDISVTVQNTPISKQQDQELWYCNDPEIVKTAQAIFAARLRKAAPARLLYHHVNGAAIPLFLRVQAINESDQPAKLRILMGDANPDKNPVRAGMDAGIQYLRSWMSGSGEILTIPPHSSIPITFRRLSPEETTSGLCGLRLISGPEDILIRTDSWPPFNLSPRWRDAETSTTPWREVGASPINAFDTRSYEYSEHIYPQPYKEEQVSYNVGGRYGFVRIGQKPIARDDSGHRLDGNFGVIYNISASFKNPTTFATDVEVVFEASAGYSGGLFVINGVLQRTPLLLPKQETRIAKLHLPPGASHSMSIMTLPLSGSSYPATITVRPVQTTIEAVVERKQ